MKLLENLSKIKKQYGETVEINPSFAPTQEDVLDLVDYYWMSKYKDGDKDATGFKKAFYNIIVNPTYIAAKMIDLDTKDIQIIAEEGQSYYPAWFFGKELNIWMKDKKNKDFRTFGQLLNDIVYNWPKYGHLVLKKAKDTVSIVPLRNIICNPLAGNFMKSEILVETHEYSPEELRTEGWDNVERAIEKSEGENIVVYEFHGPVDGTKDNYFIFPEKATTTKDLFMFDKKDRRDIYRELKWDNVPGRAMGRGRAEELFEAQIAKNQNEALFRMGLRWSSKHIFQSRDNTIAKNLLKDIENGDLIMANSEITPIAVEERNLHAYKHADDKWDKNIADMSFSHEPMSGERPPAGTPLGTTKLTAAMSGMFYDLKREDLGLFLKDILLDWIIPSFKSQKGGKHSLMLGEFNEAELDKMRGLILSNKSNEAIIDYIIRNKKIPSGKEAEIIKGLISGRIKKQKDLLIPKGYYDNLKYKIKVIITGEQIDIASRMGSLQTILQILGSNPTILADKRTRNIFYKLIDLAGFSPTDFEIEEEPDMGKIVSQTQRGGSIARPAPIAGTATVPTTI